MVRIVFETLEGNRVEPDVPAQGTLMEAARQNDVPGIDADCGGCMACGTCHVVVDKAWYARLPPPTSAEQEILDCVREVEANMRLTCQIPITEALDGNVLRNPHHQH
jgi:2Fe-2S ferredoxin